MNSQKASPFLQIDVGICTFRRSELVCTLRSLFLQEVPPGIKVQLIIADNDEDPSASGLVEQLRSESPFELSYIHCPKSNISLARNACLAASTGDYLAFIDDDETAGPNWIVNLFQTATATKADAVLGPVRAIYAPTAPAWMKKGDFHSTRPVWVNGRIRTGYTCNVLLNMHSSAIKGRRFDLALGQSGGEDTDFFSKVTDEGGLIAFSETALLEEPVPTTRASLTWLVKRRFRSGQTHGRIIRLRNSFIGRATETGLASLKASICFLACISTALLPHRSVGFLLRTALHCGAVGGILGVREIRQYGASEAR